MHKSGSLFREYLQERNLHYRVSQRIETAELGAENFEKPTEQDIPSSCQKCGGDDENNNLHAEHDGRVLAGSRSDWVELPHMKAFFGICQNPPSPSIHVAPLLAHVLPAHCRQQSECGSTFGEIDQTYSYEFA